MNRQTFYSIIEKVVASTRDVFLNLVTCIASAVAKDLFSFCRVLPLRMICRASPLKASILFTSHVVIYNYDKKSANE